MPDLDPATLAERVLRLSRSPPFDLMPVEDVTVLAHSRTRAVLPHADRAGTGRRTHDGALRPLAGRLRLADHVTRPMSATPR